MEQGLQTSLRPKKRIDALQVLRGFACMLVVFSHSPFPEIFSTSWGGYGVSIFVILSGFVTTLGYTCDTVRCDLKALPNAIKRIKTIWPLHLVMLLICSALNLYVGNPQSWIETLLALTMLKAFIPIADYFYGFLSPTWYLSLVWFFALLTPYLLRLIHKMKRHILLAAGVVLAFRLIWFMMWYTNENYLWLTYVNPFYRATDYFIGMLLGVEIENVCGYLKKHKLFSQYLFTLVMGLNVALVFSMSCFDLPRYQVLARTPLTVGTVICFYFANDWDGCVSRMVLKNPGLRYLGDISFEIYLMHMFAYTLAQVVCSKLSIQNGFVIMALALGAVIIGATVYKIIVKWILKQLQMRMKR